jgi:hypothetical protein
VLGVGGVGARSCEDGRGAPKGESYPIVAEACRAAGGRKMALDHDRRGWRRRPGAGIIAVIRGMPQQLSPRESGTFPPGSQEKH